MNFICLVADYGLARRGAIFICFCVIKSMGCIEKIKLKISKILMIFNWTFSGLSGMVLCDKALG